MRGKQSIITYSAEGVYPAKVNLADVIEAEFLKLVLLFSLPPGSPNVFLFCTLQQ